MKVIIKDFNYKGEHVDRYVCDMPQVEDFDERVQERLIDYLIENLDILVEKEG